MKFEDIKALTTGAIIRYNPNNEPMPMQGSVSKGWIIIGGHDDVYIKSFETYEEARAYFDEDLLSHTLAEVKEERV